MSSSKPYNSREAIFLRAAAAKARRSDSAGITVTPPASVPMYLPGLESLMRAMPNHIARSSLFAPIALGKKAMHKGTVMISRSDAEIRFWGEQLDEGHADIWMQIMYLASKKPLGEPMIINRAELLRSMGRDTGNSQYKWLKNSMESLTLAMLVIEVRTKGKSKLAIGKTKAFHFINSFDYDDEVGAYILRIDPRWIRMYENKEYALIDWEKRMQIRRAQDMAKSIQRLVATSKDTTQRYQIGWLKDKLGYGGRIDAFKTALIRAMNELERVSIISNSRIELSTKGILQATWSKR